MGVLTTQELIDEIRGHLGDRTDVTDAQIVLGLNLTQQRLATEAAWEELEFEELYDHTGDFTGTKSSDRTIPYSQLTNTNPREFYSISLVTGTGESRKLSYAENSQFERLFPEPEFHAAQKPKWYTRYAKSIYLAPVPDAAYTYRIRGIKWPDDLSTGTLSNTSNFDYKDEILIHGAVYHLYYRLKETEVGGRFFTSYRDMVQKAKGENIEKPDREIKPAHQQANHRTFDPYNPWIDYIDEGPW